MHKTATILAVVIIGCAVVSAIDGDAHAHIKLQRMDITPEGKYAYAYETSNGISAEESGDEHGAHGSFSYHSHEGKPIHLTYVADENGFQPKGDHLPVSPPIPDLILRSLEYIRSHPVDDHDGHRKL